MPICINKSLIKINGTKRRENILNTQRLKKKIIASRARVLQLFEKMLARKQ